MDGTPGLPLASHAFRAGGSDRGAAAPAAQESRAATAAIAALVKGPLCDNHELVWSNLTQYLTRSDCSACTPKG